MLTVAFVALVAAHATASDKPLLISIAVANTLDMVSTHIALQRPNTAEGNALMAHRATALGLKSGITALEMAVIHRAWTTGHKRAAIVGAVALTAMNGVITVSNARVGR
jgi:hypothetical protein